MCVAWATLARVKAAFGMTKLHVIGLFFDGAGHFFKCSSASQLPDTLDSTLSGSSINLEA